MATDNLAETNRQRESERPSDVVLVMMLRREAELRVSSEIQEAIEKAERSANSEWMDVIDMLQRSIVREFNANQKIAFAGSA